MRRRNSLCLPTTQIGIKFEQNPHCCDKRWPETMKKLFLSVFLMSFLSTYGQVKSIVMPPNSNIYLFNNSNDTLYLTEMYLGEWADMDTFLVIDSIQIDGVGSKEIIIYRKGSGQTESHGGTFDISESISMSKYEVWNLDTKTLLFTATNFYTIDYNSWHPHMRFLSDSAKAVNRMGIGHCFYSYDFSMDSTGQITITNLNDKDPFNSKGCSAGIKEGVYLFRDGEYRLE